VVTIPSHHKVEFKVNKHKRNKLNLLFENAPTHELPVVTKFSSRGEPQPCHRSLQEIGKFVFWTCFRESSARVLEPLSTGCWVRYAPYGGFIAFGQRDDKGA